MGELTLPCPMCGHILNITDGPSSFECRECGEQLRAFQNETVRGVQAVANPSPAYGGAVRYVVVSGDPEEHHNWSVRNDSYRREYARLRWNRIRWYVATAAILVVGLAVSVAFGLAGGWSDNGDLGAIAGLAGLATLVLITLTAAIGSHYQRRETAAETLFEAWCLREPLNGGKIDEDVDQEK